MFETPPDNQGVPDSANPAEITPTLEAEIEKEATALIDDWLHNVERIEQALDNIGDIQRFPRYLVMLSMMATSGPVLRLRAADNIVALLRDALKTAAIDEVMKGIRA